MIWQKMTINTLTKIYINEDSNRKCKSKWFDDSSHIAIQTNLHSVFKQMTDNSNKTRCFLVLTAHTHTPIFRLQYNNIVELVICLLVYTMMVGIRRKHTPNIYDVYNNRSQSSNSLLHQQQIERIACAFCAPRNVNCLHSARSPTCNLMMLHLFAEVCTMFDVLPVIWVHFSSFLSLLARIMCLLETQYTVNVVVVKYFPLCLSL